MEKRIKPTVMVMCADETAKFIFYGDKKLTGKVSYRDGDWNFDSIDWKYVEILPNGFYNYNSALKQLLAKGHINAGTIAWVLEKVLGLSVRYFCFEEDKLYMEVR